MWFFSFRVWIDDAALRQRNILWFKCVCVNMRVNLLVFNMQMYWFFADDGDCIFSSSSSFLSALIAVCNSIWCNESKFLFSEFEMNIRLWAQIATKFMRCAKKKNRQVKKMNYIKSKHSTCVIVNGKCSKWIKKDTHSSKQWRCTQCVFEL